MEKVEEKGLLLYRGDCLQALKNIENGSVHLIATDPPYYFKKGVENSWDNQWDSVEDFLGWTSEVLAALQPVLCSTGSGDECWGDELDGTMFLEMVQDGLFTLTDPF